LNTKQRHIELTLICDTVTITWHVTNFTHGKFKKK